jgi:membrane fusion protein (multidrug efflux system)
MTMKKLPLIFIAVHFVAMWTWTGCMQGKGADAESQEEKAKPVQVATLGRADMAEVLSYVVDLKPYTEVKIFSPVPDRILYFPWKNGDEIRRGQRVALIRKEGLDKGLEQIVAQMEALDVQINNLKVELERSQEMLKAGVITRQTFDKIQTSYLSTIAQRKSLEASKGQLAVRAGNAVINSPVGGVIANKMLEVGDMAVPQIPLCQIMALDRMKAHLKLVESDVPKIRNGLEVKILLDCCPDEVFHGEVSRIYPYLNSQTRTNTVEVILDNPRDPRTGERKLKPGMFGQAELIVEKREGVLVAPEPALLLDNQLLAEQKEDEVLRRAFVVEDGNLVRKRLVKLGARRGALYEVLEGLSEGERIVIRGQHGLKDNQKVEIVAAKSGPNNTAKGTNALSPGKTP